MGKYLNMDKSSIMWAKSLLRIAYMDSEALNFIAEEMGIPEVKLDFYKGFASQDNDYIKNLFGTVATMVHFPKHLIDAIIDLLNTQDIQHFIKILDMKT